MLSNLVDRYIKSFKCLKTKRICCRKGITTVTALNRGTSIYLMNLLGMFDILTQEIPIFQIASRLKIQVDSFLIACILSEN